jgi:large subunit ribosomal protein L25
MTVSTTLSAAPRTAIGKANRKLAHEGAIPAVLYGAGQTSVAISVDRHDFELFVAKHAIASTIVVLELEGEKKPINVMIREIQTSPLKGKVLHVDFLAVRMDKPVHAAIPLKFVNDPIGVKAGGVFTTNFHEVNVEAKPNDLPTALELDVSSLDIGDALHVSDVIPPAGVTILDDADEVLVSVQAPRLEVEEEGAAEEAEPEVIGEKAEEGE